MLRDGLAFRNVLGLCVLFGGATGASADAIGPMLSRLAHAARFAVPTRAAVAVARGGQEHTYTLTARGRAVLIEGASGFRALVHPGKAIVVRDGKLQRAALGDPLPETDFLLEDLTVFYARFLAVPQVSDDGPAGIVITGAPAAKSVYPLVVLTLDREHPAIRRAQYYRDNVTNLAKIQRTTSWHVVGGKPRPAVTTMEDLRANSTTTLTFTWEEAPTLPNTAISLAALRRGSS